MIEAPKATSVSLRRGFWFVFDDGGDQIVAGGSALFGKEYVFVNGGLIAEKRSHGRTSQHEFECRGKAYRVVFHVLRPGWGEMECALYRGGTLVKKFRTHYWRRGGWNRYAPYLLLGTAYGIALAYFRWSAWSLVAVVVLIFTVRFSQATKNIVIEEVPE